MYHVSGENSVKYHVIMSAMSVKWVCNIISVVSTQNHGCGECKISCLSKCTIYHLCQPKLYLIPGESHSENDCESKITFKSYLVESIISDESKTPLRAKSLVRANWLLPGASNIFSLAHILSHVSDFFSPVQAITYPRCKQYLIAGASNIVFALWVISYPRCELNLIPCKWYIIPSVSNILYPGWAISYTRCEQYLIPCESCLFPHASDIFSQVREISCTQCEWYCLFPAWAISYPRCEQYLIPCASQVLSKVQAILYPQC